MSRICLALLTCSLLFLSGCVGDTNVSVEEQLKARVAKVTELKDIKLREDKDGSYSGWGMSDKGFTWDIKLKPDPDYGKKFALSWSKGKLTYRRYIYVN